MRMFDLCVLLVCVGVGVGVGGGVGGGGVEWCGGGGGGGVESHRPYQIQHTPFDRDRKCDTTSPCGMNMRAQRIINATAQPTSTTRRAVAPLVLLRQGRRSLRTAQHTSWASIAFPHYGTISKHARSSCSRIFKSFVPYTKRLCEGFIVIRACTRSKAAQRKLA